MSAEPPSTGTHPATSHDDWSDDPFVDVLDADGDDGEARDHAPVSGSARRVPARVFVAVVGLGIAQAVLLVLFLLVLTRVVDATAPAAVGVAAEQAYVDALRLVGALALIGIGIGLARHLEFTVAERAGYEVVRELRMEMYGHLQRMRPDQLQHRARGGLLLRMTGDLSMLRMWISRGLLEGTAAAIVLATGLGIAAWISPAVVLGLVFVYAVGSFLSLANGRSMRRATRAMRRRRSLLIGNVDEQINALAVSQVSGRTEGERARLARQNDSLTGALVRVAVLRGRLRGISTGTAQLATVAALGVGLVEVHRGVMGTGQVVAAVVLARFLSRPVRTLGLTHDYWHRGLVSHQKVEDFLTSSARSQTEEERPGLRVPRGEITFDGVSIGQHISGLSVTAPARAVVAITGPSRSGKSDLLAGIARLAEPTAGRILLDGVPLDQTSPSSIGRKIGYASPDLPLLRGTVLRNLTYRARGANAGEVQRVVYALGLEPLLGNKAGARAWLHENGRNLDPGDRQLVALGRAIMDNPPVLLLDEPMASLGATQRDRVREMIRRYRGTVLMVTSDPDDLAIADQVWHLDSGQLMLAESGEDFRNRQWDRLRGGGVPSWRLAAPRG